MGRVSLEQGVMGAGRVRWSPQREEEHLCHIIIPERAGRC